MAFLLPLLPLALAVTTCVVALLSTLQTTITPATSLLGKALWYFGAVLLVAGMLLGVMFLTLGVVAIAKL